MTNFDRVVKSFAIGLAVFIITLIVSVIVGIFSFATYIFSDDEPEVREVHGNYKDYDDFDSIEIDLTATNLIIKSGKEFRLDGSIDENVEISINSKTLEIKDRDKSFWSVDEYNTLELSIPDDLLNELSIELDEGNIDVDNLKIQKFNIDLGAGILNIENSYFNNTDLDLGASDTEIIETYLGRMEMDSGVGQVTLIDVDVDDSQINAGVGDIDMSLTGSKENYTFDIETGIGSITLDGESVYSGITGNGQTRLEIEGGVGNIDITFKKESHI